MAHHGTNLRLAVFALIIPCASRCNAAWHSSAPAFHNGSGYSKSQILQMGLERFLDAYTHNTRRWQLEEAAYAIYAHYKEEDNRRRIRHLPLAERRQVKRLYSEVDKWEANALALRYDDYPHGTGIRVLFDSHPAEYEEFIGRVIRRTAYRQLRFAAAHWDAYQTNTLIEHLLVSYQLRSNDAENRAAFRNDLSRFHANTAEVKRLLSSLPLSVQAITALHITRFIHKVEL